MSLKRFYGGVHPPTSKGRTFDKPSKRARLPARVVIPVHQHTGAPSKPVVKAGDVVKTGDRIGRADAFISSPVHASISGKVVKITNLPNPVYGSALSIVIERDEAQTEEAAFMLRSKDEVKELSKEALLGAIGDSGIVGLGGAAFPTHVKLSPPKGKSIDSVILNGAECEPYLTCDYRLMMERGDEILEGLEIIVKIVGAKRSYIAIEDNKLSAAHVMEEALKRSAVLNSDCKIVMLKTKYPQGAEKQLIKSVLNRVVPAGGLPMDVGCVVQNVGTASCIYDAIYLGKPLIERCVTITGSCLKAPMNLWVRIGTPLQDLIDECGGFVEPPAKVMFGGPMMGIAQHTLDTPIVKGTSGVVILSRDEVVDGEGVCIRCGKCLEVCPLMLAPTTLMYLIKFEKFQEAQGLGVGNCTECGACAYECPSKIPLVDYMKLGKSRMKR